MSIAIDRGRSALAVVPCRSPNRKRCEIGIVLAELPTDSIHAPLGKDGAPISQGISLGNDEDRSILSKIESGRIRNSQVLALTVKLQHGQSVPTVNLDVRPFPVSGMAVSSGFVSPLIQATPDRFVCKVSVSVDVRGIEPEEHVSIGKGIGFETKGSG